MKPKKDYGLTPFEKGMDFVIHFTGKSFTVQDIAERYQISKRQAFTLKQRADAMLNLRPSGLCMAQAKATGTAPNLWRIER